MVHGTKGGHSQTLATSELSNADIIVIAPCGFSIELTASELAGLDLLQSAEWQGLDAVQSGRVAVADGNLYFNRSSCGVVETAEIVAEAAHEDLCGLFGHHGRHWVRLAELATFCAREAQKTGGPVEAGTVRTTDAPTVAQLSAMAQHV